MKKVLAILLVMVVLGLFGFGNSFAKPTLKGDWIPFATVEGQYVGQPEQLKVYYDKTWANSVIKSNFVYVRVWIDDPQSFMRGHIDYITFSKQYGVWMYQAESNRQALSYKYNRTTGRYQTSSSNIPPERISKGTVMHLLLKTLKRANPIIDFND